MRPRHLTFLLGFVLSITHSGIAAQPCTFTVTPADITVDASPQSLSFTVTRSVSTCDIQAAASDFAAVESVPPTQAVAPVVINVAANSTGSTRTTVATVAGQTVTIHQTTVMPAFQDILPSSPYVSAANLLFARKITTGCSSLPLLYCPDQTITRGEMAVLLVRTIYRTTAFPYSVSAYYTDVPPSHPYFMWIQKARDLGMIPGCTGTTFCPNAGVNRDEAAEYLIHLRLGSGDTFTYNPLPAFSDITGSPYFSWIQKLKEFNITAGCGPNIYCPTRPITRAEVGLLLARSGLNQFIPAGQPIIYSAVQYFDAGLSKYVLSLAGVSTNFFQGSTQVQFTNSPLLPDSVTVSSMTRLKAVFSSLPVVPAAGGPVSIVVSTGIEHAYLPNAYEAPSPLSSTQIDNFTFLNPAINIEPGSAVEWTNLQGIDHDITSNNGTFASGPVASGGTFRVTFLTPGTYPYHCSVHPTMTGTVVVK